jgi:hypothetical protein
VVEFVRQASNHSSLTVAISGVGRATALDALEQIIAEGVAVRVIPLNPVDMSESFRTATVATAAEYELARLAIPIHYQNLRDKLVERYALTQLRDAQLLRLLRSNELLREPSDGVFKANYRTRLEWPTNAIEAWSKLLDMGAHASITGFPQLMEALSRWYGSLQPPAQHFMEPIASMPPYSVVEVDTLRRVQVALRSKSDPVLALDPPTDAHFLRHLRPAGMLGPLLQPVNDDLIGSYRGAAAVAAVLAQRPTGNTAINALVDYAKLWIDSIVTGESRGQEQKWRGWYLVPEHGPLTLEKLRELQLIAAAIATEAERGTVLIDRSVDGVRNVQTILRAGHVTYAGQHTPEQKRDLFVRQQKNYLIKLGVIVENPPNHLAVTAQGGGWITADTDEALVAEYTNALRSLRWSWCNMPFFEFALKLADLCDGYLTYDELTNWIIHTYDSEQLTELIDALATFRLLSSSSKAKVNQRIGTLIESRTTQYLNASALGHYRHKVSDMMIAFETTGEFTTVDTSAGLALCRPNAQIPLARRSM